MCTKCVFIFEIPSISNKKTLDFDQKSLYFKSKNSNTKEISSISKKV